MQPPVLTPSAGSNIALPGEAVRRYAEASRSPGTKRAYSSAWRTFTAWCDQHGERALPASPEAVATYLSAMADAGRKVATIELHRSAISQAHKLAGIEDPPTRHEAVRTVLKGIRRTRAAEGKAVQRRVHAATSDVIAKMVARLPNGLKGTRDRALLLLGFAGAFRRSELVAIQVDHLAFEHEGLVVTIRVSKTDQEGQGAEVSVPFHPDPSLCPVRTVRAWLDASEIHEGAVFRPVNRHGKIGEKALSAHAVAVLVKTAAKEANEDPGQFAGHSLRAGLATSAARAGASDLSIMRHGRWRSRAVMDRYQRERERWTDNAAAAAYMTPLAGVSWHRGAGPMRREDE